MVAIISALSLGYVSPLVLEIVGLRLGWPRQLTDLSHLVSDIFSGLILILFIFIGGFEQKMFNRYKRRFLGKALKENQRYLQLAKDLQPFFNRAITLLPAASQLNNCRVSPLALAMGI